MVLTQEQMRNLNTIVETYGNDAQEDMAIEECWCIQPHRERKRD